MVLVMDDCAVVNVICVPEILSTVSTNAPLLSYTLFPTPRISVWSCETVMTFGAPANAVNVTSDEVMLVLSRLIV